MKTLLFEMAIAHRKANQPAPVTTTRCIATASKFRSDLRHFLDSDLPKLGAATVRPARATANRPRKPSGLAVVAQGAIAPLAEQTAG